MEPFEPPKYLASLIAAINDGAKSAQIGALAFIAIGLFLLATAFSATDEDLLLNHAISISQLGGTQVPVVFAFGLAPAVFLAAHLYTLIRYDMLASNLRQLLADLPVMVPVEADRERCRQLLANVEFVNDLVTPPASRSSSWLFRWTVVFLIAVFPVAVLLLVQISSLRLQHQVVNSVHHVCLTIDLVLLVWFFGRRGGSANWSFWTVPLRRKAALCALPVVVMAMDLAWLNVPGADATTVRVDILDYADYAQVKHDNGEPQLDRRTRVLLALPVQPIDMVLCPYVGWGCRFLTVTYRPLVAKVWDAKGFVDLRGGEEANGKSLAAIERASLRERVLRFAVLTGSELFNADLTGAQLQHADLSLVVLKHAELSDVRLQGANLSGAQLQGAYLYQAQLQGANLTGAQLQGANLLEARLQGANLELAQLQGAMLEVVQLQAAKLLRAQLQGARMFLAQLQGADLSGAQLQGTDLRKAELWNISADTSTQISLSDLRGVSFIAPDEKTRAQIFAGAPDDARQRIETALAPRADAGTLPKLGTAPGPILLAEPVVEPFARIPREHITVKLVDYDPKLAEFLAAEATSMPTTVANIVLRALILSVDPQGPRGRDLACRLLALVAGGLMTLEAADIGYLKKDAEPCPPPH